jgi:hypothetical protein
MNRYKTIGVHDEYEAEFWSDAEAVNWNIGFTDGPDCYPLMKLVGGEWVELSDFLSHLS